MKRIKFLSSGISSVVSISFALLLAGCSGTYKNTLSFNPLEPIRVAVLPFVQVDEQGKVITPDDSLLIDDVTLISSKRKSTPAQFIQRTVQAKLAGSSLDLVAPALVDAQLSHRGFLNKEYAYNYEKILSASPKEICTELLSCDAVIYGRITRWDRSYYAIQSVNTVGLSLTMVSARDGKVMFQSDAEDSDSRGLTKVPTGFSDLVIEPIRGLNNDIIAELGRSVTDEALKPLYVKNRPEFLTSAPPAILASAHDAPLSGRLSHDKPLIVVMLGSGKESASFSLGDAVVNVPMVEKADGHYIGEFYPLASDSFKDQTLTVALTDPFGRTTTQNVGHQSLSLVR